MCLAEMFLIVGLPHFQIAIRYKISELLPWVILTQILRICTQKHCILLSFYATSTSTWALITCNSYFYNFQGLEVSINEYNNYREFTK